MNPNENLTAFADATLHLNTTVICITGAATLVGLAALIQSGRKSPPQPTWQL